MRMRSLPRGEFGPYSLPIEVVRNEEKQNASTTTRFPAPLQFCRLTGKVRRRARFIQALSCSRRHEEMATACLASYQGLPSAVHDRPVRLGVGLLL